MLNKAVLTDDKFFKNLTGLRESEGLFWYEDQIQGGRTFAFGGRTDGDEHIVFITDRRHEVDGDLGMYGHEPFDAG